MAPVDQQTETSPTPWLTRAEFDERLEAAVDGDGEALHSLFFGPAPA